MPYASKPERCGIYTITSPSGKMYIGSSTNIPERWNKHLKQLRTKTHHNTILQNAFDKYGADLKFNQVLICRKEDLLFYEQLLMDSYKPEYNLSPTAANTLGYKHSEETKLKLKEAWKNRSAPSEETRKRTSESSKRSWAERRLKGTDRIGPLSEEIKKKIGLAIKGIKRPGQNDNRKRHPNGRFVKVIDNS